MARIHDLFYLESWLGPAPLFPGHVLPGHGGTVLIALVALAAGLHMRWIDNSQTNFRAFPWIKSGTGITCLALAAFLITSLAMQGPGVTCHDPSVVTLAEHDFVMIKVYVTKGGNPMHERLLEQYKVKGVPPLVFLDTDGTEMLDLRLVDYLPPDHFLGRMAALKKGHN